MNKKKYILSNYILAFAGGAFVLFYLFLSFNNRVADEDLVVLPVIQSKGFFGYLSWYYQNWSGRFSSVLYFLLIMSATHVFEHIHYFFFIYHCITLLLLLYSLNSIIRIGIQKLFHILLPLKTTLLYSILFVAGFYFSTFEHSQVWWWLFASTDTLAGITFLLLGISLLLKERKNTFHYLGIGLSFIYVGGGYEIYSMIVGALFLFAFFYLIFIRKYKFSDLKKNNLFKGVILAISCFLISAVISYTAPGNFARRNAYGSTAVEHSKNFQYTDIKLDVNIFFSKRYLLAFVLSALWLLIGIQLQNNIANPTIVKRLKKITILLLLPIVLSFFITYAFQIFVLINYAIPLRGWTFTSFSLFCFSSFAFLFLGYRLPIKLSFLRIFYFVLIPVFVLLALSTYLYREYGYVTTYVKEYDQLITLLRETKNNKEIKILYVDPLPDSGMLMRLELEKQWITDPMKKIFELDYEIKVKG